MEEGELGSERKLHVCKRQRGNWPTLNVAHKRVKGLIEDSSTDVCVYIYIEYKMPQSNSICDSEKD